MPEPTKPTAVATTSDPSGAHDEPSTLSGNTNSIAEASKAFRAAPAADPATPAAPAAAGEPAADPAAAADAGPKRNADGTFAPKDPAAAAAEGDDPAAAVEDPDVDPAADPDPAAAAAVEPKIFKLAGDPQRGEEDIELDITGLPEEVVKRLEINETRGMRRKEFNQAMEKVTKIEGDFVEFETMLKMNPEGVVLDYMAPASRLKVGAAILLEHWDEFAPTIQALWEDPTARKSALLELRNGAQSVSASVQQQVETNRKASAIRRAVETTIPDKVDPQDAVAYRAAAHAVLVDHIRAGKEVTPDSVPQLLTSLAQRYGFGTEAPAAPAAPARPKLAVIPKTAQPGTAARPATAAATAADGKTPVVGTMSPERFAKATAGRQAARQVAPQGAGALPVKQPGPPEGASIAEASAFLRGTTKRR